MRATLQKFIWLTPVVAAFGIAVAIALLGRSPVTLTVISVQGQSGRPVARCEIHNRGDKPVELTIHSMDQRPFYDWLERSGTSWRPVLWGSECGIDAETRFLAPGQTLPFTASIYDASQPIRLAVRFRMEGVDYAVSSKTIIP